MARSAVKAKTPTWAVGSLEPICDRVNTLARPGTPATVRCAAGFTLLELMVVLAIVAIATAGVGFALRDDTQARLELDAQRLAALLEAARAQSQVRGVPVRWHADAQGFRFDPDWGTDQEPAARQWLDADTRARVEPADENPAQVLTLGPDAIITPQTVTLYRAAQPEKSVRLATDGVRPFTVRNEVP